MYKRCEKCYENGKTPSNTDCEKCNTELKRKTQENDNLKEKFKKFFGIDNQECWDIAFLKDENARYRKALEEIEKNIKDYCKNMCMTETKETCEGCQNTGILNIINKAKGKNPDEK